MNLAVALTVSILVSVCSTIVMVVLGHGWVTAFLGGYVGGGMLSMVLLMTLQSAYARRRSTAGAARDDHEGSDDR